jgi:hypothetical protein
MANLSPVTQPQKHATITAGLYTAFSLPAKQYRRRIIAAPAFAFNYFLSSNKQRSEHESDRRQQLD